MVSMFVEMSLQIVEVDDPTTDLEVIPFPTITGGIVRMCELIN